MLRMMISLLFIAATTTTFLALPLAGDLALAQFDSNPRSDASHVSRSRPLPEPAHLTERFRPSEPPRRTVPQNRPGPAWKLGGREASENLTRVGCWPYGPSYAVDVDLVRHLVFIGSGGAVLVLDDSDPTNPVLLYDEIRTFGVVHSICFDPATQRVFIAAGEGGLEIWDVSDPRAPRRLSVTEVLYYGVEVPVNTVDVYRNFAVVECSWGYVQSFDVTDPTAPEYVSLNGFMGNPAHDLHISQEDGQVHATGAGGLQRLAIQPNGALFDSGGKGFTYGAGAVFGTQDVAYVGYSGNLLLVDLLAGGWPIWNGIVLPGVGDVVVRDGYAYTISDDAGLTISDVHNYSNPFIVSSLAIPWYPERLQVRDHRAYVSSGVAGLSIVDVKDVANPAIIGSYRKLPLNSDNS